MNHTTNYALNQWEASDRVQRVDFNADNAKLDAALEAKCEIVTGTYKGNGAESQFIDLGFTPKALLVTSADGSMSSPSSVVHYGGLAIPGHPVIYDGSPIVTIVENGFQVYYSSGRHIMTNSQNGNFHYLAFR